MEILAYLLMCRRYLGQCVISVLVLALCTISAGAQESDCRRRSLPVAVRDKRNLPIQDISPADFEAKVHGKPVKFLSLAPDPRPHRIVLVLDTSGSMGSRRGESPLFALEAVLARHFFDVNRQRAQIALVIFNTHVNEVIEFAPGNSAVAVKLQQMTTDHNYIEANVKGKTALRDAIFQGLLLLVHPSSADALYVLSDGGDNASKRSAADVIERLAVTSVRLFAVVLQGGVVQTPEELSGPEELAEMATKSGGEVLSAAAWHGKQVALSADPGAKLKTQETLSRLYQAIVGDSLLEIELPISLEKNEHWKLKLSDAARRKWKGAQITYPTTLLSCTAEVSGSGRH